MSESSGMYDGIDGVELGTHRGYELFGAKIGGIPHVFTRGGRHEHALGGEGRSYATLAETVREGIDLDEERESNKGKTRRLKVFYGGGIDPVGICYMDVNAAEDIARTARAGRKVGLSLEIHKEELKLFSIRFFHLPSEPKVPDEKSSVEERLDAIEDQIDNHAKWHKGI